MHLIQDENGNIVEHNHSHHQDCEQAHCQEHDHEGCSSCGAHTHNHTQEAPAGDKMTAVLDYMLKHNEHHAAELDQVAEKLRAEGKDAAAEQIKKAVDEFQKGNLYLSLALSMVKTN